MRIKTLHNWDITSEKAIVLDCCGKYRLPEPSRIAHQTVTRLKISIRKGNDQ
ncbi:MAG: endonuclease V [Planctomycetes bacterium]|nr:endonuclease V [Planctomycetota bacterium]MBU1518041.1 endonuclease V [Planctomycetota bacterium]MBU2458201.1 endonuclease V [Planctomycetota bacterium]MBU2596954.1 endonuclease V [Planctomycetota bacterium]